MGFPVELSRTASVIVPEFPAKSPIDAPDEAVRERPEFHPTPARQSELSSRECRWPDVWALSLGGEDSPSGVSYAQRIRGKSLMPTASEMPPFRPPLMEFTIYSRPSSGATHTTPTARFLIFLTRHPLKAGPSPMCSTIFQAPSSYCSSARRFSSRHVCFAFLRCFPIDWYPKRGFKTQGKMK